MAKARAAAPPKDDSLKRDLMAIGLATLGTLILVSLLYQGDGIGVVPSGLAAGLRLALGLGSYAVPLVLFLLAALYGFDRRPSPSAKVLVGASLLAVAALVLLQLRLTEDAAAVFASQEDLLSGGGYLGAGLAWVCLSLLGQVGTLILTCSMACVGLILLTQSTLQDLCRGVGGRLVRGADRAGEGARAIAQYATLGPRPYLEREEEEEAPRPKRRKGSKVDINEPPGPVLTPPAAEPAPEPVVLAARQPEPEPEEEAIDIAPSSEPLAAARAARKRRTPSPAAKGIAHQPTLLRNSDLFVLPATSLLTTFDDDVESAAARQEAAEQIIKLEDTLASFGITAKVVHFEPGPVLTRYEVEPERGIRVNQVVRLADDLAMALAAVDVRVEAPIPGKSAIGIEVPNANRVTVGLRALLETESFQSHSSRLAVALGRDIAGQPVIADISTMPHLLIAGATGSGKSVCLHGIIMSLLLRSTPDEVRFIMIDPKRVELAVYDGIPHLMAPVVYSVKHAADVLRKAIREMEKRYDKFALKGVVNLAEYNALAGMPKEHATDEFEPLPHVVIIIDELADLMMQGRAEFEFSICRIAQLARATGIHLILATQRPSVKVVTGNIKANIPTRIALAVASQVDSRTILDGQGAERLIGRGDMLYSPLDASKPRRIQGAFVPRGDIERVVEHLRHQGEPQFEIIPETQEEEGDFADDMDTSDELYAGAVQYVVQEGEASVSMIQRRFKVGYARAGRLIDMMEQRGVVGPHEGSKPRQVLIGPHGLDGVLQGRRPLGPTEEDLAQEAEDREGEITEEDVLMAAPAGEADEGIEDEES